MKEMFLVGLGGCLGSIARYKLGGWILHHATEWRFPLSTFVVNVIGCAIAGILAGAIERHHLFSPATRVFLFAGVLGGFTTFSAFGLETSLLLRRGEALVGCGYALASVVAGVAAFWLSFAAAHSR
jgi:fluoride exporter